MRVLQDAPNFIITRQMHVSTTDQAETKELFCLTEKSSKFLFLKTKFINTVKKIVIIQNFGFFRYLLEFR
jgi:hypothetical protein